jgi:hypothetical protein
VDAADKVRAEEAWIACAVCLALVEAKDREELVERHLARVRRKDRETGRERTASEESDMRRLARDHLERLFWAPRSG